MAGDDAAQSIDAAQTINTIIDLDAQAGNCLPPRLPGCARRAAELFRIGFPADKAVQCLDDIDPGVRIEPLGLARPGDNTEVPLLSTSADGGGSGASGEGGGEAAAKPGGGRTAPASADAEDGEDISGPGDDAEDEVAAEDGEQEPKPDPKKEESLEKIEWESVKLFHDKDNFDVKVKGPIKVELHTQALVDGLTYTVDWHPLNAEGKVMPVFRSADNRPKEEGGLVSINKPRSETFHPPYDNPHGFEVRVRVPPQQAVSGNTTGAFLNIYVPKGDLVK